jgi:hypothetical protein
MHTPSMLRWFAALVLGVLAASAVRQGLERFRDLWDDLWLADPLVGPHGQAPAPATAVSRDERRR